MIQEISPHNFDNTYRPLPPDGDSLVLCYRERRCLMRQTREGVFFPSFAQLLEAGVRTDDAETAASWTYLFSVDEVRYYLVSAREEIHLPGYEFEPVEVFRRALPRYSAFAGITGFHLWNWYANNRFCGRCAGILFKDQKERMLYCPKCKNTIYPRINPAVIIGVTSGDRILLSKYAGRTYKKYALLAGYCEIGETAEETVRREVMEEVGLRVKNIRYYKSQPWAFTGTILMGFYCEVDGEDTITLDEEELALAQWFSREDIPVEDQGDSLTNEMIFTFKQNQ